MPDKCYPLAQDSPLQPRHAASVSLEVESVKPVPLDSVKLTPTSLGAASDKFWDVALCGASLVATGSPSAALEFAMLVLTLGLG